MGGDIQPDYRNTDAKILELKYILISWGYTPKAEIQVTERRGGGHDKINRTLAEFRCFKSHLKR